VALDNCLHLYASVIQQYNLVPVKIRWCSKAGKVTVGLVTHWPCVTDFLYPPTGSRPIRGRWAPHLNTGSHCYTCTDNKQQLKTSVPQLMCWQTESDIHHRPVLLRHFCDASARYKTPDLLTYLFIVQKL